MLSFLPVCPLLNRCLCVFFVWGIFVYPAFAQNNSSNSVKNSQSSGLVYAEPEEVGWDGQKLSQKLDAIIQLGLDSMAFPGCQLLVAKDGKIVFDQAYGYHTYQKQQPVKKTDLYDLASITKVSAALPGLMKLTSEGKIDLDAPFSDYWPDFARSNKKKMTVREVLAHKAGLIPYIAFWVKTVKRNGSFKKKALANDSSELFPVRVYDHLYLNKDYREKMFKKVRRTKMNRKQGYVYSGLTFLLYPQIIENLSGQEYKTYLNENFYQKLGAQRLTFNPWKKFPLSEIVPTENDTLFRKTLVHGYVHDEAAAFLGGVSGNAGLFSNAADLAKLFQMYMNMGTYAGERYIDEETLKEFTSYQYPEENNRRGLGFDKPLLTDKNEGYVSPEASESSFGHTGFTGTFVWADPENQLLIVLLTNRVYPYRSNGKLYSLRIRQELHEVLYEMD